MSAAGRERGSASSQYELVARLAEGGMAEIFLARAMGLAGFERHVVLKRIRRERDDDPHWVQMFLDEARLAALLQHPNVAQVFDLGQIGDAYFYTMEYVHGEDVRSLMTRAAGLGQRVPLEVTLAIAVGTAAALAHAHERCGTDGAPLKIVHRDVTPSNIMVSYEGVVKVLDFGVAKARSRSTETQAGTIVGKTSYLSPEQLKLGEVDHRSDIFSLGIVLYELLTQSRLFRRQTDYDTLAAVARYEPPPPSSFADGVPAELDRVVMRALAKEPAQRFPTAATMLEALEAVADLAGVALSPREVRRYMRETYGTRPEPWRELESRQARPPTEPEPPSYSGEVIGPLTRTVFPVDVAANDVPLLPARDLPADGGDDLLPTPMLQGKHVVPPAPPASPASPAPARPTPTPRPAFLPPPETLLSAPARGTPEVTHDVAPLPAPHHAPVAAASAGGRSRSALVVGLTALLVAGAGLGVYIVSQGRAGATAAAPTVVPIEGSPSAAEAGAATPDARPALAPDPAASAAPAGTRPRPPARATPPARRTPKPKPGGGCTDPLDCQY
jgi:serine/threonine-protein kinase